jgi:hypothetical protein
MKLRYRDGYARARCRISAVETRAVEGLLGRRCLKPRQIQGSNAHQIASGAHGRLTWLRNASQRRQRPMERLQITQKERGTVQRKSASAPASSRTSSTCRRTASARSSPASARSQPPTICASPNRPQARRSRRCRSTQAPRRRSSRTCYESRQMETGVRELALCEDIARRTGVVILSDAACQALYHISRSTYSNGLPRALIQGHRA